MAFYIWRNKPTVLGILGIFTVLGGSLLYTLVKMNENRAVSAPEPASSKEVDEEKVEMVPKQQQV